MPARRERVAILWVILCFLATGVLPVPLDVLACLLLSRGLDGQLCEPPLLFQQMAGNPDQQEDNVDEQYQEEGEEEVIRWMQQSEGTLRSLTLPSDTPHLL